MMSYENKMLIENVVFREDVYMIDVVSNSADADACLIQEGKEIRMNDIKSAICFTLLNDA